MSPHRALTVPDVLHEVFQYFATHPWLTTAGAEMVTSDSFDPGRTGEASEAGVKAKRMTLAHAARTCKAFAEPASRVLWGAQDGLGPIIAVLKNARISASEDCAYDWVRFEHIARRVRALYTKGNNSLSDGDDTLKLICARYVDCAIFPNLRVLVHGKYQPLDGLLLRRLCASPALLFVDTWERDATIGESLAIISDAHPGLAHLHMLHLTCLDEDGNRAFAKFNNLHTAKFRHIDNALFIHLATLPRLKMLSGAFTVSKPEMDTETAFPALQELVVDDLDYENSGDVFFLAALPYISSPSLTLFSIRVVVHPGEDLLGYLEELCAAPLLAHLREFDLSIHIGSDRLYENQEEPDEEDEEDETAESVDFAGVLCRLQDMRELKAITVFVASMVPEFSLQDRHLEAIAETWPELVRLEIGYSFQDVGFTRWDGPQRISWPSLGAIVSLAERCRKLEAIDVEFESVDARALEELEARAAVCEAPQTALRQIIVGPGVTDFCKKLSLTDPARVAAALRKLFPNLEGGKLEVIGGDSEEGSDLIVRYRLWDPSDTETDMFRLMKALEDAHLDG
ncbi:hypothetical protein GSI_11161 [Ganoderma sinense ZZ0214-1]|uniref:Uncharacterized protein n=1 Tax=Ganoderma sinense ZZ0214-1 TaxID=1077348 RepID=A0A2G8RZ32_9APHY|nr:hypothetical protein GSI_11161 [Ganoderma sinense ZZ0214-1]